MLELLGGGLLGGVFSGIFRLIPTVMTIWDKRNERAHEKEMFKEQCNLVRLQGSIRLEEVQENHNQAIDTGVLSALNESIKQQAEMTKAAGGWVAKLSALVRPSIAYFLFSIYGSVKVACIYTAFKSGMNVADAAMLYWKAEDMGMLSGVMNYYFLDRTLSKRNL